MILRYSRVFSFRYPRALRVYPRIEGNFFSTTRLAFSFFFISPSLYLSSFCVLPPRSKVVLHLFISFLSNLRVRFLRDVHTPSVLLFSSQFFYLTYIFVSFSLCYSYPFVSFIYMYIYIYVSGYRGANRISVWQTRLIFSKGRIFAKNRRKSQLSSQNQIVLRRCTSFSWNTWLIKQCMQHV